MTAKSTEYSYSLYQQKPAGLCIIIRENNETGRLEATNLFDIRSSHDIRVNRGIYTHGNWRWFINHIRDFELRAKQKGWRASQLSQRLLDV